MNIQKISSNNLKILILEDSPERQDQFNKNLIGHHVEIVDSSKVAIDKLSNVHFDILFLDHDLGGQAMVKSGEDTGYEVAKFLEENPQHIPSAVVVHSLNNVGANNICAALPLAIRMPFAWTEGNLKKLGII